MGLFDSFQGGQFGNMSFLPGQSQQNYLSQMQQLVPQIQQAQQNGTSTGPVNQPPIQTANQTIQTPQAQPQGGQLQSQGQSTSPVGQSPQNTLQTLNQGSSMAMQAFLSNPDFRKLIGLT